MLSFEVIKIRRPFRMFVKEFPKKSRSAFEERARLRRGLQACEDFTTGRINGSPRFGRPTVQFVGSPFSVDLLYLLLPARPFAPASLLLV